MQGAATTLRLQASGGGAKQNGGRDQSGKAGDGEEIVDQQIYPASGGKEFTTILFFKKMSSLSKA